MGELLFLSIMQCSMPLYNSFILKYMYILSCMSNVNVLHILWLEENDIALWEFLWESVLTRILKRKILVFPKR